jgi:hypothetical protein
MASSGCVIAQVIAEAASTMTSICGPVIRDPSPKNATCTCNQPKPARGLLAWATVPKIAPTQVAASQQARFAIGVAFLQFTGELGFHAVVSEAIESGWAWNRRTRR